MKYNKYLSALKFKWHSMKIHYHQALLEGCLDSQIKRKLHQKITYHEMKLNDLF